MVKKLVQALPLLLEPRHRHTLRRFASVYSNPVATFRRYLNKSGLYPAEIGVAAGGKTIALRAFHPGDLDTINQIFCREDYPADAKVRVFVDFGANIGIATRYFAEVAPEARIYSVEPVPANLAKFAQNTAPVTDRITLIEMAVADYAGEARFVVEPVGRYSHLAETGETEHVGEEITVQLVEAASLIDMILSQTGRIDVLKIDIEGMEERVLRNLRGDQLRRIGRIYAEYSGAFVPQGFAVRSWGFVKHFTNREFAAEFCS